MDGRRDGGYNWTDGQSTVRIERVEIGKVEFDGRREHGYSWTDGERTSRIRTGGDKTGRIRWAERAQIMLDVQRENG